MPNIFRRIKLFGLFGRQQASEYDELAGHDSWNPSHHEYLDNLGGPMLSSLLASLTEMPNQQE
jgi:hypothetical protein